MGGGCGDENIRVVDGPPSAAEMTAQAKPLDVRSAMVGRAAAAAARAAAAAAGPGEPAGSACGAPARA